MLRAARKQCESGVYHVILRGVNKQIIFEEREDFFYFEGILKRYREEDEFKLFSVCLMDNHVHILMREGTQKLSMTMKKIENTYVYWYNRKYERAGHLFQNRFISEPVLSDRQFMATARYIFNNPVKAGLVAKAEEYPWSNYSLKSKTALEKRGGRKMIKTDILEVIEMFGDDREYSTFMSLNTDEKVAEYDDFVPQRPVFDDETCIERLRLISACKNISDFNEMSMDKKQDCVIKLKREGATIRQLSRVTGLSKSMVGRMCVGTGV